MAKMDEKDKYPLGQSGEDGAEKESDGAANPSNGRGRTANRAQFLFVYAAPSPMKNGASAAFNGVYAAPMTNRPLAGWTKPAEAKAENAAAADPAAKDGPLYKGFCAECGSPLLRGAKFCTECGKKIERAETKMV